MTYEDSFGVEPESMKEEVYNGGSWKKGNFHDEDCRCQLCF